MSLFQIYVKVRLFLLVMSSTNLRDIVESKFYCTVNRARKGSFPSELSKVLGVGES